MRFNIFYFNFFHLHAELENKYKYFVIVFKWIFQVSVLDLSIYFSATFFTFTLYILIQMSTLFTPYIFKTGLLL